MKYKLTDLYKQIKEESTEPEVQQYQIYCDMLANIMGVMPPLHELLLTKPFLWLQIMCGPFTVHQYRYIY